VLVARAGLGACAFALLIGLGVAVAPRVPAGFLPQMDEGAFVIDYFLPAGTSLETSDAYARKIETELRRTEGVSTFARRTGAELGPAAATEQNRGDIMVRLVSRERRARGAEAIIDDLRVRLRRAVPEVRVEFVQVLQDFLNDLAGNPRPIEL